MNANSHKKIFQLNHVSKRPPRQTDVEFILADLTFEIADGETFSILGPSGAGKSTLLRLLNALDEPDHGEILFRGKSLKEYDVFQLRQSVGMVFQRPALLPGTVRENLNYPRQFTNRSGALDADNESLMQIVGLPAALLDRDSNALSVGQQQRVMIARALITNPKVLLMDEPTSALDPAASKRILHLAKNLQNEQGLTIVYVTHNIPEADAVADRVLLLVNGQIQVIESAETFFSGKSSQLARQFLAGEL